ncbi:MAG TPA: MBG domain-containing protein [Verrucomicrobiae bacterium]|nr:MBG domain-containing protein [Verrucomicrobiae bacterium]
MINFWGTGGFQGSQGDDYLINQGTITKEIGSASTVSISMADTNDNQGIISALQGTLSFPAHLTLEAASTLNVRLNTATDFGKIAFTGSGALGLNGTFSADLNNGFIPTPGSFFTVLSAGSLSSAFNNIASPSGGIWQPGYTATTLTLTNVGVITWANPADITYGTALSASQLNAVTNPATSAVAGTFTYNPPLGTVLKSGNGQVLTATFTPSDPAQTTASKQVTINVLKAPLTVTANDASKTYGQTFTFAGTEFTTTGLVNGNTMTSATLSTAGAAPTASVAESPYSIIINNAVGSPDPGLTNYIITYLSGNLTVNPAPLTVTANSTSKTYGQTLTFEGTEFATAGLQNGETVGTATLSSAGSPATSGVGGYDIVPSALTGGTFAAENYAITYVNGTLTVNPAPLTVTANSASRLYGSINPPFTATITGFVNGDTPLVVSGTPGFGTSATSASPVDPYPITPVLGTLSAANYSFVTFVSGTLTIMPAPLTITANNQSKVYGAALPTLTVSYSGFVNGDTVASLTTAPSLSTVATASSGVGTYPITVGGALDANYSVTYSPGTLTITPAPLTITADNQSKVYGAALPTLTASYSGFVNGDRAASLTTAPSLSTTTTASSTVGTYPITASGAADANYNISYASGTLTVTPASLTITADNQSKVYGAALPTLTANYSGFVNGDSATSLTTAPTLSTTATASSAVGTYPITATGAADANYNISYAPGALTVTPASLTITANNQSKVYGAALPTLTASYSGFVNGDTVASLATAPTLSTTATASSAVGTYPITAAGAADANYNISYGPGTLTVTPASLTITANNQSKVYGAALPTLTASYSGLVNGDTASSLTTAPTLTTTGSASSPVGTYTVSATGAVDANYNISYVAGTLTVTAAPLTVTAHDASRSFGTANPAFTGTIAGIQNEDNITATYSTIATTSSAVGTYPIVPALVDPGNKLGNYNVTINDGTLTVTNPGTPTANSQSVTVSENTATPITLTGSDPNSLALTYIVTTGPTHGSISGTAPGLTYTPNSGYFGSDSLQFKVNNGAVDSLLATVSITVVGTPTANPQSVTTPENTAATITLTGADPNSPPLPLTYSVTVNPGHGALSGAAPNLTYTPNNNYAGPDSLQFNVNNGTLSSAAATVSITVCSPAIYVEASGGNDANDGTSLATAKQTIQAGINAACAGGMVFVKAGAYAPGAELTVNKDLKIIGDGASLVTVSGGGNGNASVFGINTAQANPGPTVLISGLTIENASAGASGQFGGAVSNSPFASLTLANCTLTNNQAVGAGGVFNDNNATLVVSNSILSGNLAGPAAGGGGIYNLGVLSVFNSTISSNQAPNGGGICNSGTLIVANSTISSNLVTVNGGGGIDNGGTLTVANSTISGNQASYGGGINLANAATWTAANVTITGNGATGAAGSGGGIDAAVTGTLNNSIVAGNSDSGGADDLGGTIGTASHDLIGDAGSAGGIGNGVNGNIVGNSGSGTINLTTVLDTTLANNGGPTLTHALVVNSPAIDAGDNALIPQDYADQNANGNTTEASPDDQRGPGFPRIFSSIVDMGALEFQGAAPLVTQQPQAATVCDGAAATFTATASGTPTPTVQWQVSTDGGLTWNDVTGATSGTLSFTAAVSQSGNQYRAVFTNTSGPVDSLPAALTVNALPSTPAITADASVCADSTGNTASGPAGAATYSWTISNGALTGLLDQQSVTYTAGASGLVTLTLVVGNSSGCTAQNSVDVPINLPPTTATVGGPQTICPGSTSAALGGNTPIVGVGTWTIVRGGVGGFSSANDPNAAFTHTAGTGPIVLRWTISNPPCPDSSAEVTITLNEPPVAGADTLGTVQNTAVNAPVVKLLANDSSSIHGPLSILSVSSSSAHGGAVALTSGGTMVSYTPAHDFAGLDTFTYTLSDGHCTAQGTVAVTVTSTSGPTLNLISITANSGANFLQFAGIPTFQYVIQSASSSSGPWTDLSGTLTADATGLIIYNDSNPTSPRFYRTRVGP